MKPLCQWLSKVFRYSIVVFLLLLLFTTSFAFGQQSKEPQNVPEDFSRPCPPFRIVGNLYYVGTHELACYLLHTNEGNILINTGLKASLPLIKKNIETLNFRVEDIKILLTSQVHYDHVGAMAEMKKLTGAELMVDEKDAQVLADGGISDYELGGEDAIFEPVIADRLLQDKDTITLGETKLVLFHHPGHTKGSCSFMVNVKDEKRSYRVLIANMPTIITESKFSEVTAYPDISRDYSYTLNSLKKMSFDLWLTAHASQFNLHKKHPAGTAYKPIVFADKKSYDRLLNKLNKAYLKKVQQDQ